MIDAYNAKVGEHNAKIREYNEKLERRRKELNEKLKKMLVRKGIRTGISLTLAGLTGGLSLGLDALFDLGDVADIQDIIDMADAVDMAGDAMDAFDAVDVMDAFDAYDVLDANLLDFDVGDMDDINIVDVGEGDDLLADSYGLNSEDVYSDPVVDHSNISFKAQNETIQTTGGKKLEVSITKEAGTANKFTISSDEGTVYHVKGGTKSVDINGFKYWLPKLKG